jgi:hypothetical protein
MKLNKIVSAKYKILNLAIQSQTTDLTVEAYNFLRTNNTQKAIIYKIYLPRICTCDYKLLTCRFW